MTLKIKIHMAVYRETDFGVITPNLILSYDKFQYMTSFNLKTRKEKEKKMGKHVI